MNTATRITPASYVDAETGFAAYDPVQAEAARRLAAVHAALLARPASLSASSPGLLARSRRLSTSRKGALGRAPKGQASNPGLLGRLRSRLRGATPAIAPVKGLYLWGGVGRGKTYLMDWFAEALPLPGKRRLHFHHFMRDLHEELAGLPRQPDPLELVAERLCQDLRVLCLDEFVVTDITDATLLHGLLRAFFRRGVTLVTTSNTPPDLLYLNGLQRPLFLPAIALLKEHTEVFELDGGEDYRLRTLREEGVYHHAGEGDAEAHLESTFRRLLGGHHEDPPLLHVNGRDIPARRLGPDLAWFDFAVLCGGPRATADYIEIAREFHTILLSGVPRLTLGQDAAARRFLHLVDELYDRRVKLILSAEAPLDALYTGQLHDFAHERLISRLVEMQSTSYLTAAG
ncbi:MAG: cell division protein ZapE [Chromatiaceae bacterium]|nr:cell division protein ZapE [Candidatus Thioaporhodococcus sediminis]